MSELSDAAGAFGIWTGSFQWPSDPGEIADTAVELEDLGFGALWLGLSSGDLELHETILAATNDLVVASGIVNVWTEPAEVVISSYHRVAAASPGRFVLGLGAGHAEMVEPMTGQRYVRPLGKLAAYLDQLDAADPPVPVGHRVLAALRPKALALAAARAAGAHPYLTTPEHTAEASAILGPAAWLAPEQKVILSRDADAARATARRRLEGYLGLPNYVNNLRRYGFDDADFAGGGSDRLVDALVIWGDGAAIDRRVREHLDAGAHHVALQVLPTEGGASLPRVDWRRAAELFLT